MTETWRQTTLHPMYEVSDAGNVRRRMEYTSWCALRPLKPYEGKRGYLKVQLGFRGPRIYVHRLVALAFCDPPRVLAGMSVDHINYDHTDNRASNLRWLPIGENRPRFGRRLPDGRIEWVIPNLDLLEPPEDHQPMTEKECHDYDPAANGW